MAYEEDEPEPEKRTFFFNGSDMSKVPCFRDTLMYAIGSAMTVGVTYNLATSRSPYKLAFGTFSAVYFGYFIACRYNHRMEQHSIQGIKSAILKKHTMEGTEKEAMTDDEWLASLSKKKTNVRNFRSDAES